MTRAFIFPGQGSQYVGMGKELAEALPTARLVFEEVDETLKQNLFRLMTSGPEEELRLTQNAQPALMAVSLAIVRVLEKDGGMDLGRTIAMAAGHSLGEYSALAATGALTVTETARLLRIRGQAMQRAVPVGEGAMAAILGVDLETARKVAAAACRSETEVCAAANDNAPGQVVISGSRAAVERAAELARESGAKRVIMLPVSAPFHCLLMAPAAAEMAEALEEVAMVRPVVPIVANVKAEAVDDPAEICRLLVEQVTGMVRWRESVEYMVGRDVDTLVELGAGKVLSGLTRRIDRDLTGRAVETPADIEGLLADL